jgi:large subunit ribosomal protein L11
MAKKETIQLLVEGGKAAPGPATAPRLAALKLNIGEVFRQINEQTAEYAGLQVPITLEIDPETRSFDIKIGIPPVSSLIKKELGVEKVVISEEERAAGKTVVGNLSAKQVIRIARTKQKDMLAKNMRAAVKMVLGTVASMPVSVEGKPAKQVIREVDEGKWDHLFKE